MLSLVAIAGGAATIQLGGRLLQELHRAIAFTQVRQCATRDEPSEAGLDGRASGLGQVCGAQRLVGGRPSVLVGNMPICRGF